MFTGCDSIVGGNGTVFDSAHINGVYARIDSPDLPGYFTAKNASVVQPVVTTAPAVTPVTTSTKAVITTTATPTVINTTAVPTTTKSPVTTKAAEPSVTTETATPSSATVSSANVSPSTTIAVTTVPSTRKSWLGDVNRDGFINATDASAILMAYSAYSTGDTPDLTEDQLIDADVNFDKTIDASDASIVLVYYSYLSTGGTDDFLTYLGVEEE